MNETKDGDDNDNDDDDEMISKLNELFHDKLTETLPKLSSICIENMEMDSKRLNSLLCSLRNHH